MTKQTTIVVIGSLRVNREISVFNVNSVDPNGKMHSAASHLGLHCFGNDCFKN